MRESRNHGILLPMKDRAAMDAMAQRIRDHLAQNGFGYWAVEPPGTSSFIGMVGLVRVAYSAHFTPAVEIGWRIDPTYWGQGYAMKLLRWHWTTASTVCNSKKSWRLLFLRTHRLSESWSGSV
jgi:RimJ/RimL family protein N-acetyltransferase